MLNSYLQKLVFIVPVFLTSTSFCQEKIFGVFPVKDNKIIYEKIVTVDSTTKQQLYNRVKNWALSFYNSQKDVLQIDNPESGIVAYRGFFSNSFYGPNILGMKSDPEKWNYWETVKILLKDNKAKIVITDLTLKTNSNDFPIETYDTYVDNWKGIGKNYKEKFKDACYENFKLADEKLTMILLSIEDALKTGKGSSSDFDF